jgi:RNA polymerase sigma-70 factor (ECF subfamily)
MLLEFRHLLIETLPRMRGYAMMLTRNAAAADDLLQETAFRAIRAEDQFMPGTNFKAWLYRILRNEYVSTVRRKKKITSIDDAPESFLAQRGAQEDTVLTQEVMKAVAGLPLGQREVLIMICADGMSYDEAASAVGCSVGTIKSRLWRARAAVQQILLGKEEPEAETQEPDRSERGKARRRELRLTLQAPRAAELNPPADLN